MQATQQPSFFRRLLNRTKDLLFAAPFRPFWKRQLRGSAIVYLYHRIGDHGDHSFLDSGGSPITSTEEFATDLVLLKKMGAEFIRFSDLATCDFDPEKFYAVVSIDDGFASNYQQGLQIAQRAEVTLTIFQCSAMVSGKELIWEHLLYFLYFHPIHGDAFRSFLIKNGLTNNSVDEIRETSEPKELEVIMSQFVDLHAGLGPEIFELAGSLYPSEQQISSAASVGHEIASHGHLHYKRSSISAQEFEFQLNHSRRRLEDITGKSVAAFSYPFNSYQEGDAILCAKHYSMVATVDGGVVTKSTAMLNIPRNTFPGSARSRLRQHRWLLTGTI